MLARPDLGSPDMKRRITSWKHTCSPFCYTSSTATVLVAKQLANHRHSMWIKLANHRYSMWIKLANHRYSMWIKLANHMGYTYVDKTGQSQVFYVDL